MASNLRTDPPAETHDSVQQYLDQRLTELSRSFQTQVDALAEQMRHLTAEQVDGKVDALAEEMRHLTAAQVVTPPSPGLGLAAGGRHAAPPRPDQGVGPAPAPADHAAAFHRHPPGRWPRRNLPPPRHGPAAVDRHARPHVARDVHPYLYRPLFGPSSQPATGPGTSSSLGLKPVFGAGFGSSTSPSTGFSFGNGALAFASTSTGLSSGSSIFFNSSTTSSGSFPAHESSRVFPMSNQIVGFGSTTVQNDRVNHFAVPPGAPVFQFGGHQNAPSTQPPSLFSPPGGAPTGSFSSSTGDSEMSSRRVVKVRGGKSRRR